MPVKLSETDDAAAWQATVDALTAHLQDTVLVTDRAGRILEAFGSYSTVGGWPRDELLGRSVARFIHPSDLPRAIGRLTLIACDPSRSGRYRLELRVLQADGGYRPVEVMVSNRLADPALRALVLTIRDIAPRKDAERAREASEERFRTVTDLSGDMVAVVGGEGRIVYQSSAVRAVLGYEPESRLGGSVLDFIHPQDLPQAAAAMRQLIADQVNGARHEVEIRLQHRDGSWRWIQATGINLLLHPAVGGIVVSGRDVTARKQAELALTAAKARLDAALWGSGVALYTADLAVDKALMSPRFFEMTGIDPAAWETEEHPWHAAIHQRDRREVLARLAAFLSTPGEEFTAEYRLRTPRGWLWVLDRARITRHDHDGRPIEMAGTLIDISARKELEREIVDSAAREQQRLSQDLHDGLGQELTGIALILRSIATRIDRDGPSAAARADLETAIRELSRATQSARALAHGLHPVRSEHGGLAGALAALAANASLARAQSVSFDASRWNDPPVPADVADHVYRIAQEALANALRHSGASHVGLALSATDELLELTIADNGKGLAAGVRDAPGLGRRIMRYRAQTVGGSIAWRTTAGAGTVVVVQVPWLPAARD